MNGSPFCGTMTGAILYVAYPLTVLGLPTWFLVRAVDRKTRVSSAMTALAVVAWLGCTLLLLLPWGLGTVYLVVQAIHPRDGDAPCTPVVPLVSALALLAYFLVVRGSFGTILKRSAVPKAE